MVFPLRKSKIEQFIEHMKSLGHPNPERLIDEFKAADEHGFEDLQELRKKLFEDHVLYAYYMVKYDILTDMNPKVFQLVNKTFNANMALVSKHPDRFASWLSFLYKAKQKNPEKLRSVINTLIESPPTLDMASKTTMMAVDRLSSKSLFSVLLYHDTKSHDFANIYYTLFSKWHPSDFLNWDFILTLLTKQFAVSDSQLCSILLDEFSQHALLNQYNPQYTLPALQMLYAISPRVDFSFMKKLSPEERSNLFSNLLAIRKNYNLNVLYPLHFLCSCISAFSLSEMPVATLIDHFIKRLPPTPRENTTKLYRLIPTIVLANKLPQKTKAKIRDQFNLFLSSLWENASHPSPDVILSRTLKELGV